MQQFKRCRHHAILGAIVKWRVERISMYVLFSSTANKQIRVSTNRNNKKNGVHFTLFASDVWLLFVLQQCARRLPCDFVTRNRNGLIGGDRAMAHSVDGRAVGQLSNNGYSNVADWPICGGLAINGINHVASPLLLPSFYYLQFIFSLLLVYRSQASKTKGI